MLAAGVLVIVLISATMYSVLTLRDKAGGTQIITTSSVVVV